MHVLVTLDHDGSVTACMVVATADVCSFRLGFSKGIKEVGHPGMWLFNSSSLLGKPWPYNVEAALRCERSPRAGFKLFPS